MVSDVRDAALEVLRERGWDGLTLERVAEVAGCARSTLWRQGVSRESILAGLTSALAADYRDAMYPVLTSTGSGRDRLELAMAALCDVIDKQLPLLLASDEAFHQDPTPGVSPSYLAPFVQFLREGVADGSLVPGTDIVDAADVLMNSVLWTYTHLRGRHGWAAERARAGLFDLLLRGVAAFPAAAASALPELAPPDPKE